MQEFRLKKIDATKNQFIEEINFPVECNESCLKTDRPGINSEKINLHITYQIKSWPYYFDKHFLNNSEPVIKDVCAKYRIRNLL